MNFTILGKIKPYLRMTQRSKIVDPQAQEYLASKMAIGLQLKQQMAGQEMFPRVHLSTDILFCGPDTHHATRDLDNLVKAIHDSAQGIVYPDDCWIAELSARRQEGPEYITYMKVVLL